MTSKAHHASAVKVGGRRLSSSKHDHHKGRPAVEEADMGEANTGGNNKIDDYPRPTAPKQDDTNTKKTNDPEA